MAFASMVYIFVPYLNETSEVNINNPQQTENNNTFKMVLATTVTINGWLRNFSNKLDLLFNALAAEAPGYVHITHKPINKLITNSALKVFDTHVTRLAVAGSRYAIASTVTQGKKAQRKLVTYFLSSHLRDFVILIFRQPPNNNLRPTYLGHVFPQRMQRQLRLA